MVTWPGMGKPLNLAVVDASRPLVGRRDWRRPNLHRPAMAQERLEFRGASADRIGHSFVTVAKRVGLARTHNLRQCTSRADAV